MSVPTLYCWCRVFSAWVYGLYFLYMICRFIAPCSTLSQSSLFLVLSYHFRELLAPGLILSFPRALYSWSYPVISQSSLFLVLSYHFPELLVLGHVLPFPRAHCSWSYPTISQSSLFLVMPCRLMLRILLQQ